MSPVFPQTLLDDMAKTAVVAGFSAETAEESVCISKALVEGGIQAIELTLRTSQALDAVEAVCKAVPELIVGVGTILTPEQARRVKELGAAFGVAPGLNAKVVEECIRIGLPFAPGVVTPSELEAAIALGCRFVKFFPAEASGGIPYLRSMSAPYKHLQIQYFPLGGITENNIIDYLKEANVPVAGGSWIVGKELVAKKDWKGITQKAANICNTLGELC